MCQFKSGIILKNRVFVANYDSHSEMLEELKIKDDYLGATKTFIRAELVPPKNEWWTDPDGWTVIIDQDVTPEWFELDKEKYIEDFKAAIKHWWNEHVLIDQKIEDLTSGYYRLKRCEVKKLLKDVQVMCDSSSVQRMCDSSSVQEMYGSSSVQEMYGSSSVQRMYGSSSVQEMYGSSSVQRMCGSSSVQVMYGSSIARDYTKGKIYISAKTPLEIVKFENPKEDGKDV